MQLLTRMKKRMQSIRLTRRNVLRTFWHVGILLPFAWGAWLVLGWPAAIEISRETTRLTSPLTEDSRYVDYVQAIRSKLPPCTATSWQTDDLGKFVAPTIGFGPFPQYVDLEASLRKQFSETELSGVFDSAQPFSRESHPELTANVDSNLRWYELLIVTESGFTFIDFGTPAPGSRLVAGDIGLPMAGNHRTVFRRLRLLARHQFGSGESEKGLVTVMKMLDIADRESRIGYIIDELVANSIEAQTHETLWYGILHQSSHDLALLQRVTEMPVDSKRHLVAAKLWDTNSRYILLDALQEGHRTSAWDWRKPITGRFAKLHASLLRNRTDWNAAMRFANQSIDGIVEAMHTPSHTARVKAVELVLSTQKESLDSDALQRYADDSSFAIKLADPTPFVCSECLSLLGSWECSAIRLSEAIARTTNTASATHIAARLAAWRLKTGEFPERLDELLHIEGFPEPPADVLQDAFADAPFRYSRTPDGFIMSSVGPNGIHDSQISDASHGNEEPNTDDQVWHWPPPKLPSLDVAKSMK